MIIINRILILTLSFLTANMAFAADCPENTLDVSSAQSDGGYSYLIEDTSGTTADNENSPELSTLRLFEDGQEIGPAHSLHDDIRNTGQGSFSHWSLPDGTQESLIFSTSDNTDPRINGKSYSYCLTATATPLATTSSFHAPAPTSSLVVNVRNTGATGNDNTNDTAAIQAAVNKVAGTGGTVLVPAGTYMIDVRASINLGSNMTFKMEDGATLKAIANNLGSYNVIKIAGKTGVNVVGGTVDGNRQQSTAKGGQWGYGVTVRASSNVYIENVISRDCWGDGFIVSDASTNVNFYNVTADNNRRQGMSIVWANGVVVRDSIFKNTHGHNPQAGIDLEPDLGKSVTNVKILNSQFINNYWSAIALYGKNGPISNVTITGNTATGNKTGIRLSYSSKVTVTNNTIVDKSLGFFTWGGLTGSTITGNTVTAPTLLYGSFTGNSISNNTFN